MWCKLTVVKTSVKGEKTEEPALYFSDKNVAIVIGNHEGQGDEKFLLSEEEIYLNEGSLDTGKTKDGKDVILLSAAAANKRAIEYIYEGLSFAARRVLERSSDVLLEIMLHSGNGLE